MSKLLKNRFSFKHYKSTSTKSTTSDATTSPTPTSPSPQPPPKQTLTKVVATCPTCSLVNISDRKRILCPYCGSFYDKRCENDPASREQLLKSAEPSGRKTTMSRQSSLTNIAKTDVKYERATSAVETSSKFKSLFRHLMPSKKKEAPTTPSPVEELPSTPEPPPELEEVTDMQHRFLTVKPAVFDDYQPARTQEDFAALVSKAFSTGDMAPVVDFYCWHFGKAAHLVDLLVFIKRQSIVKANGGRKKLESVNNCSTNWKFMREIYITLDKLPENIRKLTVQSMSFCIVNDLKPMSENLREFALKRNSVSSSVLEKGQSHHSSDRNNSPTLDQAFDYDSLDKQLLCVVETYLIFLCNPFFSENDYYALYGVLIKELAALDVYVQNALIFIMRKMPLNLFREILTNTQRYMTNRLFPSNAKYSKQPVVFTNQSNWQHSVVKVLALLHTTNELQIQFYQQRYQQYKKDVERDGREKPSIKESIANANLASNVVASKPSKTVVFSSSVNSSLFVSYQEFYIKPLEALDLYQEYLAWQAISHIENAFSYCQYPFMLSLCAKRQILEKDSERQMIDMAKRSILQHVKAHHDMMPNADDMFLTLSVRRDKLIADSLNELELKKDDLKKKLRITFRGESAIDMGGVRKEWFSLLVRQIFSPVFGMFVYVKESNCYWFSPAFSRSLLPEYNLIGVLMGLAVYNSEILDIRFPPCIYRKLLTPAVMPRGDFCDAHDVGLVSGFGLYDLQFVNPALASSLQQLLEFEGDVREAFMLSFEISYQEFDVVKVVELKPHGRDIELTNENRAEYVELYVHYLLNKAVREQFRAFYHGFHSVCSSSGMCLLRAEEVELLVCGAPVETALNLSELRRVTAYDKYSAHDEIIKSFWDIVTQEFDLEQQKRLLLFATGSDRVPIGGMREMTFKITRVEAKNQLPMSHTCFNQLVLPHYDSRETLKSKLLIAIDNAEGFGFK